jgi:hypothetical protein
MSGVDTESLTFLLSKKVYLKKTHDNVLNIDKTITKSEEG